MHASGTVNCVGICYLTQKQTTHVLTGSDGLSKGIMHRSAQRIDYKKYKKYKKTKKQKMQKCKKYQKYKNTKNTKNAKHSLHKKH